MGKFDDTFAAKSTRLNSCIAICEKKGWKQTQDYLKEIEADTFEDPAARMLLLDVAYGLFSRHSQQVAKNKDTENQDARLQIKMKKHLNKFRYNLYLREQILKQLEEKAYLEGEGSKYQAIIEQVRNLIQEYRAAENKEAKEKEIEHFLEDLKNDKTLKLKLKEKAEYLKYKTSAPEKQNSFVENFVENPMFGMFSGVFNLFKSFIQGGQSQQAVHAAAPKAIFGILLSFFAVLLPQSMRRTAAQMLSSVMGEETNSETPSNTADQDEPETEIELDSNKKGKQAAKDQTTGGTFTPAYSKAMSEEKKKSKSKKDIHITPESSKTPKCGFSATSSS